VNPLNDEQRKAAAALLRRVSAAADELGLLFTRHGHELALVGGPVRDVFLGREPGDLDLTTDAPPAEVLRIVDGWADAVWTVGIDFGTVGLRKDSAILEVTTYRSEQYAPRSRKPEVRYGTSLEADLRRRDFTVNAMAARLPGHELVDPFGGLAALREKVLRTPGTADESFSDDAPARVRFHRTDHR
jgi:poly(A) polymerase